jgi:hypothetical protein
MSWFCGMSPQYHQMSVWTLWSPPTPCYGRSVTDFWGALRLKCTNYSDQGYHGDRTLWGKISTAGPGIEPGASCQVVRSHDHQATRLVDSVECVNWNRQTFWISLKYLLGNCIFLSSFVHLFIVMGVCRIWPADLHTSLKSAGGSS